MSDRCIELTDRRVLVLSGEDRKTFLQGLITNDVEKITGETWLYAGLLTPQGKYLHDFFLTEEGESLLMDCAASQQEALVRKLTLYKLRSKVDITASDKTLFAHWSDDATYDDDTWQDPRHPAMGKRTFSGTANAAMEDYETHRLDLGIPDGPRDFLQDKTLWLETNADLLNGVDFNKGCYVGQELTARMRYRGKVRRRLIRVRSDAAIPPATPIYLSEREIGDVRTSAGNTALANLKVEDLEKGPLTAAGVAITPSPQDWLAPIIAAHKDKAEANGA
ncbi:MAG: folate-binding protein [Pseudomonadota bacterium]